MLNKKILVPFLILTLMLGMSACGNDNFTADESVETEVQEAVETVEPETDIPIPVTDKAVRQTVTIKADPDGKPVSAKLKTSGEDMEESVDVDKIPFGVKISYFLEGKEVTADEIERATGNIRIRFDYENRAETRVTVDGKEVDTRVPFAFVSLVAVPEERLYNVKVNSGGTTEASGSRVIYGYALPGIEDELKLEATKNKIESLGSDISIGDDDGIPEYFEITGYASDFEMDFTATLVTNGFLKDMEESSISDISDAVNDLGEFGDGGNELAEGVDKLKDGAGEFGTGLGKYVEGAGALKEGTDALSGGVSKLSEGATALNEGTAALLSGLGTLNDNSESLNSGASGLSDGLAVLLEAYRESQEDGSEAPAIDAGAVSDSIAAETKQAVLDALSENETMTDDEKAAVADSAGAAAKEKALSELSSLNDQSEEGGSAQADLTPMIQGLLDVSAGLKDGIASYTEGVSQAAAGASGLNEGAAQLAGGIGELSGGLTELSKGTDTLAASGKDLTKGYDALESGIGTLKEGVDEINRDVFQKIGSLSYGALPDTIEGLKAMRLADKGFTAWDTYDGEDGSIVFILETE